MTSAKMPMGLKLGPKWIICGSEGGRMVFPAKRLDVSARQVEILKRLVRRKSTPQDLAVRARIVLLSREGLPAAAQADRLNVDEQRVRRWRSRWEAAHGRLCEAEEEGASDKELEELIVLVLKDRHRRGVRPKFSAEQVAQILALACERPEDLGLPFTHWTPPELARVAVEQGFVDSISPRQVDRFLKRSRDTPAQGRILAHAED